MAVIESPIIAGFSTGGIYLPARVGSACWCVDSSVIQANKIAMIAWVVDLLRFARTPEDGTAGVINSPCERFIMIPVLLAAFSLLISCASQDMRDIRELKQYEGAYQFVPSKYRGCAKWEYVQLEYDEQTKMLTVKPIGTPRLRRSMSLMVYGPLDGQSRLYDAMFAFSEYQKYVAKKTDDGWLLQDLRKDCQMRFFCGMWRLQGTISFTKGAFHVGLLQDTEHCAYLRLNSGEHIKGVPRFEAI